MTKYSPEFKLKIVSGYLEGKICAAELAQKHNILSSGRMKGWIKEYRLRGKGCFSKKILKRKRIIVPSLKKMQ